MRSLTPRAASALPLAGVGHVVVIGMHAACLACLHMAATTECAPG